MLHRAILGSLERFVGILIEHFAGKFPLWLAPEQLRLLPITDDQIPYAEEVAKQLTDAGIRATVDRTPDKLGAKIRLARNDRVTYFGVLGGQEVTDQTIAHQAQNGDKVGTFPVDDVIARMLEEIAEKTLPLIAAPV